MQHRIIMHVDMDAFYASVEQLDKPELAGLPVIVGGEWRGVVSAASYEARRFGVHSAMPTFEARRRCPNGIFLPVRMERYKEVSRKIMESLDTISPVVEQVSIDEAFVDLTGLDRVWGSPYKAALETKKRVQEAGGVTCSVGVAPFKFLAKIASDMNKPDGLIMVHPDDAESFISEIPIGKMPGVGKKTLSRMSELGVRRMGDLLKIPEKVLMSSFGRYGEEILRRARGEDDARVVPSHALKSASAENTFECDIDDPHSIRKWILRQSERVSSRLRKYGLKGKTVFVKVKNSDFHTLTRRKTLDRYTNQTDTIYQAAVALLEQHPVGGKIRLTGVGVTNFQNPNDTAFWETFTEPEEPQNKLDASVDMLRERYGFRIVQRAGALDETSGKRHKQSLSNRLGGL